MLLLISDANILIDMEAGELMERLFQLPMQFAMPDILYWKRLSRGHRGWRNKAYRYWRSLANMSSTRLHCRTNTELLPAPTTILLWRLLSKKAAHF